jgi:UDP-N-acetylglucosamine--N-acetylmuramyl-(pentapeptide) pyrophosphoryl-undecaprenol N-acetylglucosamine transferase
VRAEFFNLPALRPADSATDKERTPVLLVFGGSQGARAISMAVTGAIAAIRQKIHGLRVIHQTGERDYNEVQEAYARVGVAAEVSAFIDNMPQAFARADLLVCRSGASTVAEITAAGKPAIFIPFPQAADDHQRRNAETIANAGAAVLIPQSELTPERLAQTVTELLSTPARLKEMSERARALAHADAAGRMARMVCDLAGDRNS